jgi:hypothetical protein
MVIARWKDSPGWRGAFVVLALFAAPPSCSSSGSASAPDAGVADAAQVADAGEEVTPEDAPADARGGTGGTIRGGTGGTGRGGSGGSGGSGGNAGSGGTAPPPDAAPEPEVSPTAPPNDTCADAQVIPTMTPRTEVAATTRGARHDLDLACGAGGGDVVFSFTLAERELVYADTLGAGFDTLLSFTDACAPPDGGTSAGTEPSCVNDACGGKQSQAVALLPPGKHYLVLSGAPGESGDVTIHFEHAPVGSGMVAALPAGTAMTTGMTSGMGRLSLCEGGGAENSYWWTSCQGFSGGPFMASTCTNTMYDTMLILQIPRTANVVCNDDSCMFQAAISTNLPPGPGLHVLSVDGYTPKQQGAYSLSTTRP